ATHPARGIARDVLFECAEIPADCRPPKLVVERGSTDRPFDHDVQGGGDPLRLAELLLPGAFVTRDTQVGNRESGETGLGLGAPAGGALIPDLSARPGRGAGKG